MYEVGMYLKPKFDIHYNYNLEEPLMFSTKKKYRIIEVYNEYVVVDLFKSPYMLPIRLCDEEFIIASQ